MAGDSAILLLLHSVFAGDQYTPQFFFPVINIDFFMTQCVYPLPQLSIFAPLIADALAGFSFTDSICSYSLGQIPSLIICMFITTSHILCQNSSKSHVKVLSLNIESVTG